MTYALTGATGWIGRNSIDSYLHLIDPNQSLSLNLFASRSSQLGPHQVSNLSNILKYPHLKGIFHCAFAKRSFLSSHTLEEYIRSNRTIISTMDKLLSISPPNMPLVIISSGVAKSIGSLHEEITHKNAYAYLKKEEEITLSKHCKKRMVLILRLYGAIGPYINIHDHYALSSFIQQASSGHSIQLTSTNPIYRSYAYLPSLCDLSWTILKDPLSPGLYDVDACTSSLNLIDLATLVGHQYRVTLNQAHSLSSNSSIYVGNPTAYLELLSRYSIHEPPLVSQLKATISSLNS